MTDPRARVLHQPGATIAYDVRPADSTDEPPLLLIGSPMAAAGFRTLASSFPDRTVVTYDPRGVDRSLKTDGVITSTPQQHADDLHAVIQAVGGAADVFASSGGAVNALALVARHATDVRILIAHEPPAVAALPDRDAATAACRAVNETYRRKGFGFGMARFIATTAFDGPFPPDFAGTPDPDPQAFGLPVTDDGKRDDALLEQNMLSCTTFELDFEVLARASTRIVIGIGEESGNQMAARAGRAVAEHLGAPVVVFPGGHAGFLGNEYGMPGKPEAFAAMLRTTLQGAANRPTSEHANGE
jgi:pimeloyl-ACP methyl ester carboxylesterase